MPLGMLAQVLWEALAEGGWDEDPARSTAALETASTSSYKVPDCQVQREQNRA